MEFVMFLLMIIFFGLGPVLWIGQAIWIYSDASKRGDEYGWLWTILALIFFPIPLIVYLIIRCESPKCPRCGASVDKNFRTCPYCGYTTKDVCKRCGRTINKQWSYCPHCNEPIEK